MRQPTGRGQRGKQSAQLPRGGRQSVGAASLLTGGEVTSTRGRGRGRGARGGASVAKSSVAKSKASI